MSITWCRIHFATRMDTFRDLSTDQCRLFETMKPKRDLRTYDQSLLSYKTWRVAQETLHSRDSSASVDAIAQDGRLHLTANARHARTPTPLRLTSPSCGHSGAGLSTLRLIAKVLSLRLSLSIANDRFDLIARLEHRKSYS
jgi:hypothetical protein